VTTTSLTWGGALGAVYDGRGRRQEALGQAGRFLSERVLPPAVGTEVDGLSFFYAGREHAAIASMREKYTVMYPATATNGAVGIRCPSCQNRIGQLITPIGGSPFSVSRKLRFCPFCGVSGETEPRLRRPAARTTMNRGTPASSR